VKINIEFTLVFKAPVARCLADVSWPYHASAGSNASSLSGGTSSEMVDRLGADQLGLWTGKRFKKINYPIENMHQYVCVVNVSGAKRANFGI